MRQPLGWSVLGLLAACGDGQTSAAAQVTEPVFLQSFDTLTVGSAWLGMEQAQITAACGVGGGNCLRVTYLPTPALGTVGSSKAQTVIALPPASEYSLQYDLLFEEDWQWVLGGKLPGLASATPDSGCSAAVSPERWSARLMWRANGASEIYAYTQTRPDGDCGERTVGQSPFVTRHYQAVTLYVRVNRVADLADGVAQLYVDGRLLAERTGVQFRSSTAAGSEIASLFFSTFFGGTNSADTSWAPTAAVHARFDNLAVYPGLVIRSAPGR